MLGDMVALGNVMRQAAAGIPYAGSIPAAPCKAFTSEGRGGMIRCLQIAGSLPL